jgi:hypothetical protein
VTTEQTISEARPTDHMSAAAREKHGLPENWQWCSVDSHEQPEDYIRIEGAVYERFRSGKRKGQTNFRKPLPGTERVVFVRDSEIKAWEARQEAATGKCMKCDGTGKEWAGWSAAEGSRFRECRRCNSTGLAPISESPTP